MNRIIIFLLFNLSLLNLAQAAKYSKAKYSMCNYGKITPVNYLSLYTITKKRYQRFANSNNDSAYVNWVNFLEKETVQSKTSNSEVCEWNKFVFTDFVFYNEQAQELLGAHQKTPFLELRDNFYSSWLTALDIKTRKLEKNAQPKSIKDIKHESQEFDFLNLLTSFINSPPKKTDETSKAINDVYNLLEGKSVFNAIFSTYAKENFLNEKLLKNAQCMSDKLDDSQGENIWSEFQQCGSNKEIMDILGVFSSQRMYLIRDFKKVMFKNLNESDYLTFSSILDLTSSIYFRLETYGNKFGHKNLYPSEYSEVVHSHKPYHFYSVGFLALKLKELGYSEEIIKKASVHYARKYKINIKRIGVLYNILLLQSPSKGTVGDYDNVITEQDLGAIFGITLGE